MVNCETCGKELGWSALKFKEGGKTICKDCLNTLQKEKTLEKLEKKGELIWSTEMTDEELFNGIKKSLTDLAMHEAGTKWMRIGTLFSGNSTEQMLGAGFKALIDQNKIIIRQNELNRRLLERLTTKG